MKEFILIVVLVGALAKAMLASGLHISGPMTATDQEAQECYFGVGRDVMVTARPGSEACDALRQMVGKDVNLSVF